MVNIEIKFSPWDIVGFVVIGGIGVSAAWILSYLKSEKRPQNTSAFRKSLTLPNSTDCSKFPTILATQNKVITILIVKKWRDRQATEALSEVSNFISQKYCERVRIIVGKDVYDDVKHLNNVFCKDNLIKDSDIDLVICLGGDGTILHICSTFQSFVPPVMAFNLGSMGFLTPFDFDDFKTEIVSVLEGKYCIIPRTRLLCKIFKNNNNFEEEFLVLNEAVLDRGNSPFLTNLDCFCDGQLITTIQADGIIIASATGSTAYSLSAGGSLVHPALSAMLVTPICPHTLSFRPVVLPCSVELKIQVPTTSRQVVSVAFDGRNRRQLDPGDYILINVSNYSFPVVSRSNTQADWFVSISNVLNWNKRVLQKTKPED